MVFLKAASVSTPWRVIPFLTRGKCVFRKSASQRKGEWGGDLSWVCCLSWVLNSVFHAKNGFEIKYRPMFINKQKRRNWCADSPKWKTALSNKSNWQKSRWIRSLKTYWKLLPLHKNSTKGGKILCCCVFRTTWAHGSSWILGWQLWSLHGTELGPLSVCGRQLCNLVCLRSPS